jgi:hypothetical protein
MEVGEYFIELAIDGKAAFVELLEIVEISILTLMVSILLSIDVN